MTTTHEIITENVTHQITDEIVQHVISEEIVSHTIGAEQGPPGPPGTVTVGAFSYTHIQGVSSSEWTINHNLGFYPNVQIEDSAGDSMIAMKIIHDSVNSLRLQFLGTVSGKSYLS